MNARLLTGAEAAAYCRLTPSGFADWRRRKLLPGPIPGTRRWDRVALDEALDSFSKRPIKSDVPQKSAYERWKESRNARQDQRR